MTSTSFPATAQDWRGRFIASMAAAIAAQPQVSLSLWAPPGDTGYDVQNAVTPKDAVWLQALAQQGGIAHLLRTSKLVFIVSAFNLQWRLGRVYRGRKSDVVHVNWLQNALPLWGTGTPALITVLGTDFALLKLPGMRLALRAVLKQRRAILAPNAAWMCSALESAFGDIAEVRTIPFGVDEAWLRLKNQPAPDGVHHWLAITRLTEPKLGNLFTWGEGLFGARRQLHLFGPMQDEIDIPSWVHYHGPTHPNALQEEWFPKATGIITLSRHSEGRPQVLLEAMAAGLPVLASYLPAHCDLMQHQHTGWIARNREDVAVGLQYLENGANQQRVGLAGRQWIQDTIGSWNDCAARYTQAYRDLMEPWV